MLQHWVALNSANGLGPVRIKKLLDHYGSPEEVLAIPARTLSEVAGIPHSVATRLHEPGLREEADKQIAAARQLGARILCLADSEYPPLRKEIHAPPPVIFVRGNLDVFAARAVGVVGTRRATPYGQSATRAVVQPLAETGVAIVSGLAIGIDTLAHRTCLDAGGGTIAVLGCGIDRPHPKSNTKLARQVMERGALVSEFPLGTPPEPHNFPRRNRIISGLSAGVLVVEAGQRSGALITADYALQQGRDVFAVPGSIFSKKSVGTNNLIRHGAVPVSTAADITDNLQSTTPMLNRACDASSGSTLSLELLNEKERRILGGLSHTPRRIDQLVESLGTPFSELFDVLLNLELKGVIRQVSGQQYMKA